jgi:hypothetical protein
MKRNYMDVAVAGLSILGPIFLAYACAAWGFTNGYRTSALWTGVSGVGMLVVAMALQIQQNIWNIDASEPKPTIAQMNRERAYVSVVDGEIVYTPGKPPTVALFLRNTGLTEARDVKWMSKFELASASEDFPLGQRDEASKINLPPLGTHSFQYTLQNWDTDWEPSLKAGAVAIVAAGQIDYIDIYGNRWSEPYRLVSGGVYGRNSGVATAKIGRLRVIKPKGSD